METVKRTVKTSVKRKVPVINCGPSQMFSILDT